MAENLLSLLKPLKAANNAGKIRIVLASASPRRREALAIMLGDASMFEVIASNFHEELPHSDYENAADYCLATAREKGKEVCAKLQDEADNNETKTLVIAADTVVALGEHILEKPTSVHDATRMLRLLNGIEHEIHTGVAVFELPRMIENFAFTTTVEVKMADLSETEIAAYIATGEAMDKAGAYAIQGIGRVLIESIRGDYCAAIGLPGREFAVRFAARLATLLA